MSYDTLTLSAVRDELRPLVGGRVQRIVQVDALTIVLEVFTGRRQQLLLSANASLPCVMLVEDKARRGVETPSPFILLLGKYLRSALLQGFYQPVYERVLEMAFSGPEGQVRLICELMGRYSNFILVDTQRVVMDAVKRIPPSLNRYRATLPHQPYVAPPPQAKLLPPQVTAEELHRILEGHSREPVWHVLVDAITGISPLLGREITARALGAGDSIANNPAQQAEKLLAVLPYFIGLPETHAWEPCVALDECGQITAFAPYRLTHLGKIEEMPSISGAIVRYLEERQKGDAYRPVRSHLHMMLGKLQADTRARLASLERSMLPTDELEALQRQANAILALGWSIAPGQKMLELDAEMAASLLGSENGEPVSIPLDPLQSAAANAERLFAQYRRKKAANVQVPEMVEAAHQDLAYLEQLGLDIDLAENRSELDALQRELEELRGSETRHTSAGAPKHIMTINASPRCIILVGRSASQNEEVTFKRASGDDTWLHAHGVPGGHVVVKCGRGEPLPGVIEQAARYAAYYSGKRGEANVLVDYTRRRYVNRIPGSRPGMVTYRNEHTLTVPGILGAQDDDDAL
ncbi:MAG: NFACT family protein [Chloroflexi bacterium]|nr:NFACT family protein [Chloroflexota bacterium]